MLVFNSSDDFYALPEEERKSLIGSVFKERMRKIKYEKVTYLNKTSGTLFFPVGLAEDEFNYGVKQGLIFVTACNKSNNKWFRAGVISPDDLDIDLDFGAEHIHLRQDVIDYIKKANKLNIKYKEFLGKIRDYFGAGILT